MDEFLISRIRDPGTGGFVDPGPRSCRGRLSAPADLRGWCWRMAMPSCHRAVHRGDDGRDRGAPHRPLGPPEQRAAHREDEEQHGPDQRGPQAAPRGAEGMQADAGAVADALTDDVHHLRDDQRVGRRQIGRASGPSPLGSATSSTTPHSSPDPARPPPSSRQKCGRCRGERRRIRAASGSATRPIPKNTIMNGPISVLAACT